MAEFFTNLFGFFRCNFAWGASKEGHESDVVRNQAKTIQEFDQFCADLVYFLESLMRSCKVATQQYKEHLQHLVNQSK